MPSNKAGGLLACVEGDNGDASLLRHPLLLLQFADGQVLHGAAQDMLTRTHLESLYPCPLRELAVDGERYFVPSV